MILGGALGNLIDRVRNGYVLDFVDVYWRGWHFWAFNVADACITFGALFVFARSAPGETSCIPFCLRSAAGPSTRTACCWRPPIWPACNSPWCAHAARDSTRAKVMDLGIYLIIAALVGAKLMLVVVDFDYFRSNPGELFSLVRAGGVFYGGLIVSFADRPVAGAPLSPAHLGVGGHVRARHRAGPRHRTAGLPDGRLLLRPADGFAVGSSRSPTPVAAANVGTPLGVPLHPTQLYDAGAELLILIVLLAFERRGRPFPGRTFWLYILLYAISRFIVEIFRGDPRGMIFGMSTSQFVSLVTLPVALIMLLRLRRRRRGR